MVKILVGNTGFVGSNIYRNGDFDAGFDHTNIKESYGLNPELLVYAGLPAAKYLANQNPEADLAVVMDAFNNIKQINPKRLVLISSVDVYKDSFGKDEDAVMDETNMEAYGLNRLKFEQMVREFKPDALIVRLPALFGANLKKNFVYDLLNPVPAMLKEEKFSELKEKIAYLGDCYENLNNGFYGLKKVGKRLKDRLLQDLKSQNFTALNFTDSRSAYQFYNLDYLYEHIMLALENNIKLLNLSTEPVTASELYEYLYGQAFENHLNSPANYDFRTKHAELFGGKNGYIFSKESVLKDLYYFTHPLKLAISNIALEYDDLALLDKYQGLEIAPSKIVSEPYQNHEQIKQYVTEASQKYDLMPVSMQSIAYQVNDNIFDGGYDKLMEASKQAVDLAYEISCPNIVFGCPKNRNMPDSKKDWPVAKKFFQELGEYAKQKSVIVALEANPEIYETNFLNTTKQALDFVKELGLDSLKVNLDLGTIIHNQENLDFLKDNISLISHVHISEPYLEKVQKRPLHKQLKKALVGANYTGFVSIEMKPQSRDDLLEVLNYVREIFAL